MAAMQAASAAAQVSRPDRVAEREDAERDPGNRLGGGDRRQRVVQPSSPKCALRERDTHDGGTDYDVDPCVEEYLTDAQVVDIEGRGSGADVLEAVQQAGTGREEDGADDQPSTSPDDH